MKEEGEEEAEEVEERKEPLPLGKQTSLCHDCARRGEAVCSEGDATEQDVPRAVTLTPSLPQGDAGGREEGRRWGGGSRA